MPHFDKGGLASSKAFGFGVRDRGSRFGGVVLNRTGEFPTKNLMRTSVSRPVRWKDRLGGPRSNVTCDLQPPSQK